MFPPANLQAPVVNHQALQVTQGVERGCRRRVDKRHEADVLIGDVANVVQETTADDVANLLDCGLGVDVSEVDGAVAQVVDSPGGGGHGGRRHGLLGERIGDQVAIRGVEDVRISRRNPQELGGVLLLGLGDVRAAILAVEHALGDLPLGFLGQLRNSLHGITDGQVVDKPNGLFLDDLDGIDGTKPGQLLAQLILRHLLGQVPQVHVTRCARLLHSQSNGRGHLRGLPPTHLDIVALDGQLLQDRIGMEVRRGVAVEEGDERAVLVWQQPHRLDLPAANVVEDLFGGGFGGDVTQVHGTARS